MFIFPAVSGFLFSTRAVQPFGISGPPWKMPNIKYIEAHNHKKNLIVFCVKLRFCVGPRSQPS